MTVTDIAPAKQPERHEEERSPLAEDGCLVEEELLVEEISIDGMCGVY
jgi:mycofactocin precursor